MDEVGQGRLVALLTTLQKFVTVLLRIAQGSVALALHILDAGQPASVTSGADFFASVGVISPMFIGLGSYMGPGKRPPHARLRHANACPGRASSKPASFRANPHSAAPRTQSACEQATGSCFPLFHSLTMVPGGLILGPESS